MSELPQGVLNIISDKDAIIRKLSAKVEELEHELESHRTTNPARVSKEHYDSCVRSMGEYRRKVEKLEEENKKYEGAVKHFQYCQKAEQETYQQLTAEVAKLEAKLKPLAGIEDVAGFMDKVKLELKQTLREARYSKDWEMVELRMETALALFPTTAEGEVK